MRQNDGKTVLKKIASDPLERLHLKFLKWTLRVHNKCSNIACYGDSGRYPLAINLSKQLLGYYNRLDNLNAADSPSLVRHAFVEQSVNSLSWHQNITTLLTLAGHTGSNLANPERVRSELKTYFDSIWDTERKESKKLTYYNQVKKDPNIGYEPYLDLKSSEVRKCLTRLRSSSHRLNCETGRYITEKDPQKQQWTKRCQFCTSEEATLLAHLPLSEIIKEDEHHVLISCPRYHEHRTNLQDDTKSLLLRNEDHHELYQGYHAKYFGIFVKKIFSTRFPKNGKIALK